MSIASAYIIRTERNGNVRFRVSYRLGGRESRLRHAGSFTTQREAKIRKDWIGGELAAGRVPDLDLTRVPEAPITLRVAAEQWRASRVDVAEGTVHTYRVNLERIVPRLGDKALSSITLQASPR